MTAPFPHRYAVRLVSRDALAGTATLESEGAPPIGCGPPPQFDGSDAWWSPEGLLLGAVAACHHSTIAAMARRQKLDLGHVEIAAEAMLEKTRQGPRFAAIRLRVAVRVGAASVVDTIALVRRAHDACIVGNHVNVPVELEVDAGADPAVLGEERVAVETVAALARLLPTADAEAFAHALPPHLAARAASATFDPGDVDAAAFYARIASALRATPAEAREPVQVACAEIAARLDPELRARVRRHLPDDVAALLEPREQPHPPVVPEGHETTELQRASARWGSHHLQQGKR